MHFILLLLSFFNNSYPGVLYQNSQGAIILTDHFPNSRQCDLYHIPPCSPPRVVVQVWSNGPSREWLDSLGILGHTAPGTAGGASSSISPFKIMSWSGLPVPNCIIPLAQIAELYLALSKAPVACTMLRIPNISHLWFCPLAHYPLRRHPTSTANLRSTLLSLHPGELPSHTCCWLWFTLKMFLNSGQKDFKIFSWQVLGLNLLPAHSISLWSRFIYRIVDVYIQPDRTQHSCWHKSSLYSQ